MSFLQSGQAANDDEFRCRVQACIFKVAQDVLNEAEDAPGHDGRASLAMNVVQDPAPHVNSFAWLCAANPTIAGKVTVTDGVVDVTAVEDGELEFVCAGHWDTVVGWRSNRP